MATLTLVLGEATFTVASEPLGRLCDAFAAGSPASRYRVQSRVPRGLFRSFLEAVNGNDIQITNENVSGTDAYYGHSKFQHWKGGFRNRSERLRR
jgi:hypothetical protein